MDPKELLGRLSPKEQRELYDALAYQLSRPANVRLDRRASSTWDVLCEALGLLPRARQPVEKFAVEFGIARYEHAVAILHELVDAACQGPIAPPVRAAVLRKVMDCLIGYAEVLDVPRTPKIILGMVGQARHAVERQFPGYIQARLLHRVARAAKGA